MIGNEKAGDVMMITWDAKLEWGKRVELTGAAAGTKDY